MQSLVVTVPWRFPCHLCASVVLAGAVRWSSRLAVPLTQRPTNPS